MYTVDIKWMDCKEEEETRAGHFALHHDRDR